MVTHKEIGENRGKGRPYGYTIHLIIEVTFEQEVSFLGSKLKQPFKLIFTKFQPWITLSNSGAPARAKRAWDRAQYPWNMVILFSFGCHVIDRAYVRTFASTDCTGGVGETIKRKGGVSQACLGKSTSLI